MSKRFPSGSEWRKWDLHVHLPGTRLSDGYDPKDGNPDWDRFADILEGSDVAVVGITDYFTADQQLAFINHYKQRYPKTEKLLLVNLELRLNETVNNSRDLVDYHVIFSDLVPTADIQRFATNLRTEIADGNGRRKTCVELEGTDFSTATVTRSNIEEAFRNTFGTQAEPTDYLLYLAPASNNGIRAQSGNQRKANLSDEIDKSVHAIFGKSQATSDWYLKVDRYEDHAQSSKPKPVFGGCDAHSFDQLKWLGKSVSAQDSHQVVTWIKADPTFAGLQQTLVEPRDRVSLAELRPDAKDPYKVIRRVIFPEGANFPDAIPLNPNLNALIGSRSSGKSALLAHIAHSIEPTYTEDQQRLAAPSLSSAELGPAAGVPWSSVQSAKCTVEWSNGKVGGGNVIYIPQNWLYQISDSPREVTKKIQPVIRRQYPEYFREHERNLGVAKTANETIGQGVAGWFDLADEISELDYAIRQMGDRSAIEAERDAIGEQIEKLGSESALSAEELQRYQEVLSRIAALEARATAATVETEQINPYVVESELPGRSQAPVSVDVALTPSLDDLPEALAAQVSTRIEEARAALASGIAMMVTDFRDSLSAEIEELSKATAQLRSDNADLIERHSANTALDVLVGRQAEQQAALSRMDQLETQRGKAVEKQDRVCTQISDAIAMRASALAALTTTFRSTPRELDQLTFDLTTGYDDETVHNVSVPFHKREKGPYIITRGDAESVVDVGKAQSDPAAFLDSIHAGRQRLNSGYDPAEAARSVLLTTPEVRFTAELDGDIIGGFTRSTMTPGKQALFALTLILGEAADDWTLLIDQPEDDLDSRSIFHEIVQYLIQQKRRRQIVLATHNANLVIGADAEEVLVANRHGDDRKNADGVTFDYLTGSLEHSEPKHAAPTELSRMGIREHTVDILDGGEEAFQKRRDKYKI